MMEAGGLGRRLEPRQELQGGLAKRRLAQVLGKLKTGCDCAWDKTFLTTPCTLSCWL